MRMLSAVRVRMGPSSVVISGWKLYSTVVYLPMTIFTVLVNLISLTFKIFRPKMPKCGIFVIQKPEHLKNCLQTADPLSVRVNGKIIIQPDTYSIGV